MLSRFAWLTSVLLTGCGGVGERLAATPSTAAASSNGAPPPSTPSPHLVLETGEDEAGTATTTEVPPPLDPAALIGWWRGDDMCIELFENGDFELSKLRGGPKVMAMGAATVTAAGDGFELQLATARVWRARFTGPCRKIHKFGGWADADDMLGVNFKPGATSTLTMKPTGDAQVELCGQRCVALSRETPRLGARWRRADLTSLDGPEGLWRAGDLLEIDLGGASHVWVGFARNEFGIVYGQSAVNYASPDRFTVTFVPERFANVPRGTTATALDLPFAVGQPQTLSVRRLAGERIEVCAAADQCAMLERRFDDYHHDFD